MDGRLQSGTSRFVRQRWDVSHCRSKMATLGVDAAAVAALLLAAVTADYDAENASALIHELSHRDYQLPAEVRAHLFWQISRRDSLDPGDE